MEQNDSINFLFLFLCILLLGFVYLNTQMMDQSYQQKQKATINQQVKAPFGNE